MKRAVAVFLLFALCLCGCNVSSEQKSIQDLQNALAHGNGCKFDAVICAMDDGTVNTFTLQCIVDVDGKFTFTVLEPESIQGISGTIDTSGGKLTFRDVMIPVQPLADGVLSPLFAPWLLYRCMTEGLLRMASSVPSGNVIIFDDVFRGEPIQIELLISKENLPVSAEIFWQNRCIIQIAVENFVIM